MGLARFYFSRRTEINLGNARATHHSKLVSHFLALLVVPYCACCIAYNYAKVRLCCCPKNGGGGRKRDVVRT